MEFMQSFNEENRRLASRHKELDPSEFSDALDSMDSPPYPGMCLARFLEIAQEVIGDS
jgi:hypothetical protein